MPYTSLQLSNSTEFSCPPLSIQLYSIGFNKTFVLVLVRMQHLVTQISCICQEICDIKKKRQIINPLIGSCSDRYKGINKKTTINKKAQMDTPPSCPGNNSSDLGVIYDKGGWDEICYRSGVQPGTHWPLEV